MTNIQYFRYDTTFLFNLCKLFLTFSHALLQHVSSIPKPLFWWNRWPVSGKIFCKLGYKVQLLGTSTQNLTFTLVKTDRKRISDFRCQKLHNNNNDNKPPKTVTITNHVKYRIEISTFADKIDTSDIYKYKKYRYFWYLQIQKISIQNRYIAHH